MCSNAIVSAVWICGGFVGTVAPIQPNVLNSNEAVAVVDLVSCLLGLKALAPCGNQHLPGVSGHN